LAIAPAGAVPGVPPEITSILDGDTDIDPGESRAFVVEIEGLDSGATLEFSGLGLDVLTYRVKGGTRIKMQLLADAAAEGGLRDLTVTNPDGLSDTYVGAMEVTGTNPAPEFGDITVHVFEDLDGNGIEDAGEPGLVGVDVNVVDFGGASHDLITSASGDATLIGAPIGDATITYATPAGMTHTTTNDVQVVTVLVDSSVSAAAVGYMTVPTGSVDGHVFSDEDGNGVEDGADAGLEGVSVSVTDANGAVTNTSTDVNGDYSVAFLAVGDADVSVTTPVGYTLTSANDSQVVAVTDGGTATAGAIGYQPPSGAGPEIVQVLGDPTFDPGDSRKIKVEVLNFEEGGTFSLSGYGVSVTLNRVKNTTVSLAIGVDADADAGPRDLTVTNPGGLSDTLVGAITVTGGVPPVTGDVTGHVFDDIDGNGIEDGGDTGLSGVTVSFLDFGGQTWPTVTDGNGDFVLTAGVGEGTLTITAPPLATLTTNNNVQFLTVTDGGSVAAAGIGYKLVSGNATFANVAPAAGIIAYHSASGKCSPPIGVGSAWADFDGDGDQDLFKTSRDGANLLYRNDGDLTLDGVVDFTDVAGLLGIDAAADDSFATAAIDYDNDGDTDLFVANATGNTLWQNQLVESGSIGFVDVSGSASLEDQGRIETATWGDVDGDGHLDVYYAKHMTCATDGDFTDRLFHNNGDGTFSDWTTYLCSGGAVPCTDVSGLGFAAGMFDYDNDGDTDIYLVNDNINGANQPNKLWRNDGSDGLGGWVFTEVGASADADGSVNGMGLGIGDYNNDGFFDLAFSDAGPGHLLMNDGDGTFTDVSSSSGVTTGLSGGVSWGTAFLDYNNDGWQDLFFAQGQIGSSLPMPSALLENQGDGTYLDVSDATGMADEAKGRNVSLADFNEDGWVDVFVGNYNSYPLLMQNNSAANGNTNEWLTITVEGTESNRDGIGTVISVTTGAGTQTQMISSGGSHGGGSQKAAFFGLDADTAATVSVTWPNGAVENLGSINSGQSVHLTEPAI
jgi:hypothetical protein